VKTLTTHRTFIAVALALGSFGVAACGGDDDNAAETTDVAASDATDVEIKTFAFNIPAAVPAGTVTVINADDTTHTFTHVPSDGGDPAFSVEITGPDTSDTITVGPGTYEVRCNIHTSMTGTLTVT
jgi:plastocyanin